MEENIDINDLAPQQEVAVKKKRGRKPKDKIYFGEAQEDAVRRFINSTNEAKNILNGTRL